MDCRARRRGQIIESDYRTVIRGWPTYAEAVLGQMAADDLWSRVMLANRLSLQIGNAFIEALIDRQKCICPGHLQ